MEISGEGLESGATKLSRAVLKRSHKLTNVPAGSGAIDRDCSLVISRWPIGYVSQRRSEQQPQMRFVKILRGLATGKFGWC
jgi:hypothetical protein